MNILLLDDNAHRITFFQNGLKAHKLTICRHARAAIKALKQASFDVVFLDHDLTNKAADPADENCGSEGFCRKKAIGLKKCRNEL